MIIKCEECGHDVSDKAVSCPNCGYILQLKENYICSIYGIEHDFSYLKEYLGSNSSAEIFCKIHRNEAYTLYEQNILAEQIAKTHQIPRNLDEFIQKDRERKQINANKIKCPKCGSTAVTTGARGVNAMFGLIGASKTVNRCGKCGKVWKP